MKVTFPHEFNPLNFQNEQGQFEKPEAFIPFSSGPWSCLGEGLARMELFLILVTLLRRLVCLALKMQENQTSLLCIDSPYRMGEPIRKCL
ncbi:cytochrome P450 2F2-like [Tachysurus ichikawai]